MTSFQQEPPSADLSSGSQCFDPLDSFINYDQTVLPTPSISPLSSRAKSISTPLSTSSASQQTPHVPIQPSPQTYAGPSHQYEQYKQQAGLPVGALANTFAVNQADQFSFNRDQLEYGMNPPSDSYFGLNSGDDFVDFGTTPIQSSNGDMDLDFGSPIDLTSSNDSFVNPATIAGQDGTSQPQQSQMHPGRAYPGMHQQAALAKEAARQQQLQQQQQKQQQSVAQQQKMPGPSHSRHQSRSGNSSRPPTDPIVEESISRLLNQMRHSSVTSSNEDTATPNANGGQSNSRSRKDEEDMDEDERLLASEEGKKLSSKERRQLRNKVSARAFRSRRKEYIGQLEGEIAAKQSETDELRAKNEALMSENTRLTDLTRMLLSSPAFSTFLNDLSANGVPASIPEPSRSQNQASTPRPESAAQKDANPNQAVPHQATSQQQNNMHVGLTMIPEEPSFDFTANPTLNTGYANNPDFGGLYDAQVYAVTSVPEGPPPDTLNFSMLHGKTSNFVGSYTDDDSKDEPATIERMPAIQKIDVPELVELPSEEDDIDACDPAFALFLDQPRSDTLSTPNLDAPEHRIFGEIELDKAFGRVELVLPEDSYGTAEASPATVERFKRLCSRLEISSTRIAAITGYS
ncbi:hypothetical protein ACLMJK_002472 [Lecanora helva]